MPEGNRTVFFWGGGELRKRQEVPRHKDGANEHDGLTPCPLADSAPFDPRLGQIRAEGAFMSAKSFS